MDKHALYPPLELKETVSDNHLVGLWRLMQGFRLLYLGAIISLAVATVAKTLTYLLLKYFVDVALIEQGSQIPFYLIGLGFVALALFQGVFTFISGRLAARSSEGVILRLRNYLFDHLQRLPFRYHDRAKTGDLVQRCSSDIDTIRQFFADQALGVGRILLLFLINFAALLSLNLKLALWSLACVPIVLLASLFFAQKIRKAYEAHQEQEGILSTNLQENLTGVRVVKAFARQQFETDKFKEVNQEQLRRGQNLILMHSFYWPIVEGISGLQLLLIYSIGGWMAIQGEITIGTFMAMAGLVIWIIWPMQNLGRLIVHTSMGLVSYQRVAEILKQETEIEKLNSATMLKVSSNGQKQNGHNGTHHRSKLAPIKGTVEFQNVYFEYEEDQPVLHDLSFTVDAGQTIAILGPTGSGKSSLVNLLPRFYHHTRGSILLDGKPIEQYSASLLRQRIGLVEQEPFLFSRTLRENIAYGVHREIEQAEIEAAAQIAAIHDVILTFPNQYDTLVGEKGVTLSGGQKQRLVIARTVLKNPAILIFDDAVSAVDTETEAKIHQALDTLQKGRTTFIIAHRIQTVMQADKIIVLDKGRIVQHGSHQELMAQDGIYRHIYDLQTQEEEWQSLENEEVI